MIQDTIAAISTPAGRGGIGVIRISGDKSLLIAQKIFFPIKTIDHYKTHYVYYGNIRDNNNQLIDEVLFIYMKSPRSYTAEDVVEIQSHSSPVVLRKILDLIISSGAEIAQPGEFTKRAFINGRIDLTQAEAVIDIINAKSRTSLDMAVSQIKGGLKKKINTIIKILEDLKINIEAVVDFPDDVGDIIDENFHINNIKLNVIDNLKQLEQNFKDSNIFRDGINIVIAGPPNSGKSSLINNLLNKEKSIVTSVPGTTRDIIEDFLNIDGIPFIITDTAGIQETEDYVEQIGIKKTHEYIRKSDILILMFDRYNKISDEEINELIKLYNDNKNKKVIVVENKIDIVSEKLNNITIKPHVKISVKDEIGIDGLRKQITDIIIEDSPVDKNSIIPNTRHYNLIKQIRKNCQVILEGLQNELTYDLIAIELSEALELLYEITGKNKKIDVLDGIFNSFCIGK